MNFWRQIPKPIIGLSPMDGVTDCAFRHIIAKHAKPDVILTEFTNVEGLSRNATVMLDDFIYSEIERPVVAQIYGSEPESFYKASVIVCELGFDGIDVNMGCPAKKVAARGCGAALIKNPPLAKEILRQVKRGIHDWCNGLSAEELGLKPRMALRIRQMNLQRCGAEKVSVRKKIPLSVKTRIGYEQVTIDEWVKHLLEEEPATISLHGRTLKQAYSGAADWEAIARAAEIVHQSATQILGNGDLQSIQQAAERVKASGVDGVLIGRSAIGAPWIFRGKEKMKDRLGARETFLNYAEEEELHSRFAILLDHARYFEQSKGNDKFSAMRKHLGAYCKHMPHAAELRRKMFQTKNSTEVAQILHEYLQHEAE